MSSARHKGKVRQMNKLGANDEPRYYLLIPEDAIISNQIAALPQE